MAYASITKPSLHFNAKLYTGNGGTQSITGVGFQPDWCWLKNRSATQHHQVFDVIRGATKRIYTSSTAVEDTASDTLTSFDSDGFSLGANGGINGNGNDIVAWNWKAGGSGSANAVGDINSTVSANTTSGFSVLTYTGNSSTSQTVGHGLGVKPSVLWIKRRSGGAESWLYWVDTDFDGTSDIRMLLSGTQANYNNHPVTFQTTTFTLPSTNDTAWNSSDSYVAYCFAEIKGFSKFGKYDATGTSNDGPFIYTGFKPAWVLIKRYNSTENWYLFDNKRDTINPIESVLYPNLNNSEGSLSNGIDLLSNGFKVQSSNTAVGAGDNYTYMAFAAEPLVANVGQGIPATAI
jgi:hypothetical protein